jgi:hypothetical protein
MRRRPCRRSGIASFLYCLALVLLPLSVGYAQTPANSDPTYSALRNLTLGTEAVTLANYDLKRDAGTFRFRSGTVCFVAPVDGKVTGAVFVGDGLFLLEPPNDVERRSLSYLTKQAEFAERFERLLLRFTDRTYGELKKAGTPTNASCDAGVLKDSQNVTRHRIKHNLDIEILAELLSPNPRPLFVAFIHGKEYNGKEIYEIDPNMDRDQVDFRTYDENKMGDWASFDFTQPPHDFGRNILMQHHALDTTFEKSGMLSGKATTTFVSLREGLRVVRLSLFPTLRVQSVTAEGQNIPFIQENKNDDADFAVILPKPLNAGQKFTITTIYAGKDAVIDEGGGNYFPIARQDWYPNSVSGGFGEYALYDMTFRIPKGMQIAATGALVSETNEGNQNVTVWKSETPQTVAGFSLGRFKIEEGKLSDPPVFIQSFANEEPPYWAESLSRSGLALGNMSTTSLNKKALAESELEDFVNTYRGKAATTEDFKYVVEKHMTQQMDLDGNHKMDWFFDEYVYGTQLPSYKLDYSFETGPNGDVVLSLKIAQSNVDAKFKMLVPVYLEFEGGRMSNLGHARVFGSTTLQQKVPLKGVKTPPRRAVLNYYDDVLASPN